MWLVQIKKSINRSGEVVELPGSFTLASVTQLYRDQETCGAGAAPGGVCVVCVLGVCLV